MTRLLITELIGTFALVFAGCGAIIVNDISGGVIGHIGIAMTFGLVVMAMIYAAGDTSGAHFNPAVTIGDECPYVRAKLREDWDLDDSKHMSSGGFRNIGRRVQDLLDRL